MLLRTESEARRRVDPQTARWWEIVNTHRRHLGEPVGYRLIPGENVRPFADLDAAVMKRAGSSASTSAPGERYAAGEYNQHPGGAGLPGGPPSTGLSSIAIWSSGTRSATITSREPRTGP